MYTIKGMYITPEALTGKQPYLPDGVETLPCQGCPWGEVYLGPLQSTCSSTAVCTHAVARSVLGY